ncbi:MAG TPA: response regulator [Polyangiaceae bacterium]|nr:response regulator [Polyangiaceae bacterium]
MSDSAALHILVVDDDPLQLRTSRRVLARLGFRVTTCDGGDCARRWFEQWRERRSGGDGTPAPFDLVIMDMMLRDGGDGLAIFEELRQIAPEQRGLLVSGHPPQERAAHAERLGLAWLTKPYTADALAEAVRAALVARVPKRT